MRTALLALLLAPLPALAAPLDEGLALLAQGKCEPALNALAPLKGPLPEAGQKVAARAGACRTRDKLVGFALTEKALELAPGSAPVMLAHAESLLALEQGQQAAGLLDTLLKQEPRNPLARVARAEAALLLNDPATADQYARPLERDPQAGERARRVLIRTKSSTALDQALVQARKLDQPGPSIPSLPDPTAPESEGPGSNGQAPLPPGALAAGGNAVSLGGQTSFVGQGLRKGKSYRFRAYGACTRSSSYLNKDASSGVDYRVQVGGAAPIPFAVPEWKADWVGVSFVAEADNPTIKVFEKGDANRHIRCELSQFEVR